MVQGRTKDSDNMENEREYWRFGRKNKLFPDVPFPKWILNCGDE